MNKISLLLITMLILVKLKGQVIPVFPTKPSESDKKTDAKPKPKIIYKEKIVFRDKPQEKSTPKDNPVIADESDYTMQKGTKYPLMVKLEGGTFSMGSNRSRLYDVKPVHNVTLNKFYIGKYEVTVKQFAEFIVSTSYQTYIEKRGFGYVKNPTEPGFDKIQGISWRMDDKGNKLSYEDYNKPVIWVSWDDAEAYCVWLSQKTGKNYRLPTEAEWEYAAKGGYENIYSGSDNIEDVGWYKGNCNNVQEVGKKKPNNFGIFDMSGNVEEWCGDWYDDKYYFTSPTNNPTGAYNGKYKVLRGGCWYWGDFASEIVSRVKDGPNDGCFFSGFRVVFTN